MAKGVRRSPEELAREIDDKVAYHKYCIQKLETKKDNLFKKKVPVSKVVKAAKEAGMTAEDIAEKLGVDISTLEV